MNKLQLTTAITNNVNIAKHTLATNSPAILSGTAIVGLGTTVYFAIKATPTAERLLKEREEELDGKLAGLGIVKTVWKCYIPTIVIGSLTTACIVSANTINTKRNTALAGAYSMAESKMKDYQNKVVETIGENKAQKIENEVKQDRVSKVQDTDDNIIVTGKGEILCFDMLSGRYFKSCVEEIRKSVNDLNASLMQEMTLPLNNFYSELGLPEIRIGDDLGWDIADGMLDLTLSTQMSPSGIPCNVMDFDTIPLPMKY